MTEPYAWQAVGGTIWNHKTSEDDRPLYTKPFEWQGLTDDDVNEITKDVIAFKSDVVAFIREAEAKLREKNTCRDKVSGLRSGAAHLDCGRHSQVECWGQLVLQSQGEERMSKLTPTDVKNVYLACDMRDPSGMYADEVDLLEFADKLERTIMHRLSLAPREPDRTCVRCKHGNVSSKREPCKGCFSFDKWEPV
jgi:hypothetical protein